jgi:DNA ligase-1
MKDFARLLAELDSTTATGEKLKRLRHYFEKAEGREALCALALFTGWRPPRLFRSSDLRQLATEVTALPLWLVEEAYHFTGDLAETLALITDAEPEMLGGENPPTSLVETLERLVQLSKENEEKRKNFVRIFWQTHDRQERFVFNKLLTGGFRIGVAERMARQAFAQARRLNEEAVAQRTAGIWDPLNTSPEDFFHSQHHNGLLIFPFCLAHPLNEADFFAQEKAENYLCEYKWDGIRGQLLKAEGQTVLWSRGGENLGTAFPELLQAARELPDDVALDGEILIIQEGKVSPFQDLQKRIGRKKPTPSLMRKYPAVFLAFDLLRLKGEDLRELPLIERRRLLEDLMVKEMECLGLNPAFRPADWHEAAKWREQAPEKGAEGLMIKALNAPYVGGRKRGLWWKWKVEPFTVDAVLLYAQAGHGRRAGLYTDFTFAVWHEGRLVPFAKAYSGLTDEEMKEVNRFIQRNTIEKFGPVRSVKPELVFELAFEGIQPSNRHKSGLAVRFPRILRWRRDKQPQDADSLNTLFNFLNGHRKT